MQREKVLITGGASGIGAACAARCEADGFEVVSIDLFGNGLIADLSDTEQTQQALKAALADGPITRIINNVGTVRPAGIMQQTLGDLDATWALNVRCALQCVQSLLPGMEELGFGRIVNVASRAALGKQNRTAYAASKAALLGMTRVWALELGRFGVTANAIGPGPIRTTLFENANPPDAPSTQKILEAVPLRRIGTPEDIAHAASYFLDLRTGFVTGQTLYICGGLTVGTSSI